MNRPRRKHDRTGTPRRGLAALIILAGLLLGCFPSLLLADPLSGLWARGDDAATPARIDHVNWAIRFFPDGRVVMWRRATRPKKEFPLRATISETHGSYEISGSNLIVREGHGDETETVQFRVDDKGLLITDGEIQRRFVRVE